MNDILVEILSKLTAAWDRRGIAIAVAWFVCLGSWTVVTVMPDTYKSSALVYVDTANILKPLLQGLTVEPNISAEVELMQRTLFSRPNLTKVARETDLDLTVQTRAEMDHLIERLGSNTEIQSTGPNLFSIEFENDDPAKARDVVQTLLDIFVESNLGKNRRQLDSARKFIEDQLKVYERQLNEAEERLAKFKQKNLNIISLSGASTFQGELQLAKKMAIGVAAELRDAKTRRATLRRELQTVPQFFPANAEYFTGPPSNIDIEIIQLEARVEDLLSRFTENHPDVVIAHRRLNAAMKQQEEELQAIAEYSDGGPDEVATDDAYGESNPVYEQLKVQLVQEKALIATLIGRVKSANAKLDEVKAKANRAPELEAELKKLNRDYGVLKSKYTELISRREAERISRARDLESNDVQFRIMEPPQVPTRPSGPNRYLFLTVALIFGVGSGVGFSLLIAMSSETFAHPNQLKDAFPFAVLGPVSVSEFASHSIGHMLSAGVFWTLATGLIGGYLILLVIEWKLGLANVLSGEIISRVPSGWLRFIPGYP